VLFDSAGRFRACLLLHTPCMHSSCNWIVDTYTNKERERQIERVGKRDSRTEIVTEREIDRMTVRLTDRHAGRFTDRLT